MTALYKAQKNNDIGQFETSESCSAAIARVFNVAPVSLELLSTRGLKSDLPKFGRPRVTSQSNSIHNTRRSDQTSGTVYVRQGDQIVLSLWWYRIDGDNGFSCIGYSLMWDGKLFGLMIIHAFCFAVPIGDSLCTNVVRNVLQIQI